jgi:5-methylcytosine-specific restriction endonuclease McrA
MNENFIDKNPSLETYWRSIILLGRNTASYKFALAKSLIEIDKTNTTIRLEDLAVPFAKNICEHLLNNNKQNTLTSSKFLDICRKYNNKQISEDNLKTETIKLGFVNVIDAFHNVSQTEVPRFFEDSRKHNKSIILTDSFYKLMQGDQKDNINGEIDARWQLWETAISLNINSNLLIINSDIETKSLYVINNELRRINVTSSKGALNGYQKGKCFYCLKDITILSGLEHSCDVDHFFPHMLKNNKLNTINQVWNLVLTCKDCNRGTGGKFERIPIITYLELLNKRNNFYIESHHPLKETIINQTGNTKELRIKFLQDYYNKAIDIIPTKWEPKETFGDTF